MVPDDARRLSRRTYLTTAGASLVATAGCLGSPDDRASPSQSPSGAGSRSSTGDVAPAGSWPQLGRGPGHAGYASTISGRAPPTRTWAIELDGPVTTPTVVGDTIYLTRGVPSKNGPKSTVEAYSLTDGTRKWSVPIEVDGEPVRFAFSAPNSNRRPVYHRGSLYVALGDRVTAIDVSEQEQVWVSNAYERVSFNAPPTVTDDGVFAGALDSLVAFDFRGNERWAYPSIPTASPGMGDATQGMGSIRVAAVTDGRVHVSAGSHVAALDATDGSECWKRNPKAPRSSTAVATAELLVRAGFQAVETRALDGTRRWTGEGPDEATIRPAVDDSAVYVAGLEGTVAAYDRASGDRQWKRTLPFTEWAQGTVPVLTANALLVVRVSYSKRAGRVHSLDPTSGEELWRLEMPATRMRGPVAASGHYVFTSELTPESERESSTISAGQETTTTLWAYQPQ